MQYFSSAQESLECVQGVVSHQLLPEGHCSHAQRGMAKQHKELGQKATFLLAPGRLCCDVVEVRDSGRSGSERRVALGTKFSWQKAPSLPSHCQDSVFQLVTKSPAMFCAETQGRIFEYLPGLLYYYKLHKVQHCGSKCPIFCSCFVS